MNKRKLDRKSTGVFFGVYDRVTTKYVGRLVDINTNGLMLLSKLPLEIGTVPNLKMDLPQEIRGKWHLEFDAKVIWCEKCKNIDLYGAGLQFTEIAPIYSQLIDELISSSIYNDEAAALPISAQLNYGKKY